MVRGDDRQRLEAIAWAALAAPIATLAASISAQPPWVLAATAVLAAAGAVGLLRRSLRLQHQLRDLQARLAAEAAKVAHAQALIDNLVDGVITTDAEGIIEWSNPAANSMFGYETAELRGQPCSHLLADTDARASPLAAMCTATGLLGRRRDGAIFPLDVAVGTLQLGDRPLLLLVLRDATARQEAEKQRVQAQKLESMGVLVAGIAHEIGTPLQYVSNQIDFLGQGFAALLASLQPVLVADGATSAGTGAETSGDTDLDFLRRRIPPALQHVRQGLDQVVRIVAGLRNYSHPGQTPRSRVDVNRVLADAVEITRNSWKHVATAHVDLAANPAVLHGHAGELMQVFVNLLVNAADAISDRQQQTGGGPGRIDIATSNRDDVVVVEITDDGCGIDAADRARVFDLFFTTKPVGKGTGQGLAVAHSVVQQLGGEIGFAAATTGGTRFFVHLPLLPTSLPGGS